MKTFLAQNQFNSASPVADDAAASSSPHDAAAALSSSDGSVQESLASIPDYNGVKSPALVTAHGLSGKSCPLSQRETGPSEATGPSVPPGPKLPADASVFAGLSNIQSSCVGVGRHANDPPGSHGFQVRIDPGAQEMEVAVSVRTAAASDLDQLANYFRRHESRFVPDREAIWDAMFDETAPRVRAGDPVWADEAPLFLKAIG